MMDFKLDPEAKSLWLEALRDPTRKQAQSVLSNGKGMCCLGVACDISDLGEWGPKRYEGVHYTPSNGDHPEDKGLPLSVSKWLGLPTSAAHHPENPRIPGLRVRSEYPGENEDVISLAQLNDSGFTFAQIADVIDYFM